MWSKARQLQAMQSVTMS